MDRISPNFIYAFILTRASKGLLHIICPKFLQDLWPLIYARISFRLNILRTNQQNFTKFFIYAFTLTRSSLGLVHIIFGKFVTELWSLFDVIFFFSQYLETRLTEFHQI